MNTKEYYFNLFTETLYDTQEYHIARLWEIVCWQNDIDDEDEVIGEIYDQWVDIMQELGEKRNDMDVDSYLLFVQKRFDDIFAE